VPAGHPLQPPTAAETITPIVPTEETLSTSAEAQDMPLAAPVSRSRPPSQFLLPKPIAAPDGAAAVEHSDVVPWQNPGAIHRINAEMEQLMEQYAAPHHATSEGEIESGQVVAVTDSRGREFGRQDRGAIPAQEFAELDGPFPLQPGQPVEVQRTGDRKDGYGCCPTRRVAPPRAWGKIEDAYRNKTDISGRS